ncbi:non-ribosomal peptide synthetase [Crocosphaera watsonii]|uniref:Peptide synthetase n=3 Tax=Crocosphaera watsonii TaxID=263511 RepID=T2J984_CROWT|nr:non-ribosomal peptide synthetase [Crocosphaera watsonii]CCQ61736.1 Peptide synthetase [Crocosphaera watsonii WH 0401]
MKTDNIQDIYQLSPAQQGLLFHTLYAPESTAYCDQYRIGFKGDFNTSNFEKAWQITTERHAAFRTCFFWEEVKEPVQVVYRKVTLEIENIDWRDIDAETQEEKLDIFLKADQRRSYELSKPPLMRLVLIQTDEDGYQFIWSNHHILFDGWSRFILFKEVLEIYQALNNGNPIKLQTPFPYRKYIAWLREQNLSEAEAFWRQELQGVTASTPLVVDKLTSSTSETEEYIEEDVVLSLENTEKLKALAQQNQLTINTLIQGVWALLLNRYSGDDNVIFGATTSGRPINLPGVESAVGLFINSLPVRAKVNQDDLLIPWLKTLQTEQAKARQYEWCPMVQIQGWSEIPKGIPLFNSLVIFENYPVDTALSQRNENLQIADFKVINRTNYPLTILVSCKKQLSFKVIYDLSSFAPATIKRMLGHLQTLLSAMLANPQQCLSDLPLLTETERHQLLYEWNNTKVEYSQDQCIHQLFEAQAEKTPHAVAVEFEDQKLTYQQLNTKANQLAHYLRSLGVKPEVLVGICVERSLEMVIGLLAILKAGGAYVPIEPTYPTERIQYLLEDSKVAILLTQNHLTTTLPEYQGRIICLDTKSELMSNGGKQNLVSELSIDNLIYIIYTSGSTGKPKGTMNTHQGVVNRLLWMQDTYQLTTRDRVLQKTPFSFDVSAWEFWWPLMTGACLVVAQPEGHKDPTYLIKLIKEQQITIIHFVPSMLQIFLEEADEESCSSLRKVFSSGEALTVALEEKFFSRLKAELHNLYGPTEAAIDVTFWQCQANSQRSSVPIGRPIANTQTYILDVNLQPVPVGVPGELYLGGVQLARGYLNRPELTAERFIENPFMENFGYSRLYKTGDLVCYLPDGNIEYLGRLDNQVKIRGLRIELGEIEAQIAQYETVKEAVVIAREEIAGDKRLVAYLVPQEESTVNSSKLRKFLREKLPNYMIPSAFVTLEELPLTPNGKIDRKALPDDIGTQISSDEIVLPSTPIENLLAGIWAEILGIETVGINNNFFELGGHSLIATRVISQIRQVFKVDIPIRYLFEKPTITQLAEEIEKAIKLDTPIEVTSIKRVSREQELPLSYAQQRLWFLTQLDPDSPAYNLHFCLRLSGPLNIDALSASINEIVKRHEVLRTNFTAVEGQPFQVINPESNLPIPMIDLRDFTPLEQEKEIYHLAKKDVSQPFDLENSPLLRVTLLKLNTEDHVILLTMHHIISDAWSMGVFVEEIAQLYPSFSAGKTPTLAELPIQYADFAVWQRQWLQGEVLQTQLDYWKQQLGDTYTPLTFPQSSSGSKVKTNKGAKQSFMLSKDLTEAINLLCRQEGVTLYMTLLSVFQVLLHYFTGAEDIRVGSPIANRNRVEIEKLIGFFINTLVLRIDLSGNPSFRELLVRARKVTLDAYANQDVPFEKLVEELQPERNLHDNPLYHAWFVLQNTPTPKVELSDLTLTSFDIEKDAVRHDLLLGMSETSEGLGGEFKYKTDLFPEATIAQFIEHLKVVLQQIVEQPNTTIQEISTMLIKKDEQQQQIQKQKLQAKEIDKLKTIRRRTIRS